MRKLIERYRSLGAPAKASLWFVVSNVLLKGISFITLPIFSRLLTTSEYGIVAVFAAWSSTVSIVTTLTIWGGVFNVGMSRYPDRRDELVSSFQGLATTITLASLFASLPFLPQLSVVSGMSELLVACVFVDVLASIPFNLWSTKERYDFNYRRLVAITAATSVLNPLLGVLAVLAFPCQRAEARIVSGLIVSVLLGACIFTANLRRGRRFFSWEFWRFGFLFNAVLVPHYLSMQVLNQSDRLMISNICGSGDAGIFSVAYSFGMLVTLVTNGINSSATPYVYQCLDSGETEGLPGYMTGCCVVAALLVVALVCVVPEVFMLMLPESYYPALAAVPPVAVGAFFLFLYPQFGAVEFYFGENKLVAIASVVGAVLNVALNALLLPTVGFVAAAYTTLLCYMCFSGVHCLFMRRVLRERGFTARIFDLRAIALVSTALLVATFGVSALYGVPVARWAAVAALAAVAAVNRKRIARLVGR